MRVLKLAIISAIVLFLLVTAISSLLPSHIRVSRAIDIDASPADVHAGVNDLKQWDKWNEYIKALAGSSITTDSIHSNELSVFITGTDAASVRTKWRQKNGKSFAGVFKLIAHDSATTLQWYFDFSLKWYPWEKLGSIMYDKQLGPGMEQSLGNLKQLLEKAP